MKCVIIIKFNLRRGRKKNNLPDFFMLYLKINPKYFKIVSSGNRNHLRIRSGIIWTIHGEKRLSLTFTGPFKGRHFRFTNELYISNLFWGLTSCELRYVIVNIFLILNDLIFSDFEAMHNNVANGILGQKYKLQGIIYDRLGSRVISLATKRETAHLCDCLRDEHMETDENGKEADNKIESFQLKIEFLYWMIKVNYLEWLQNKYRARNFKQTKYCVNKNRRQRLEKNNFKMAYAWASTYV